MILDNGGWLVAFDNSELSSAKAQGCVLGSRIVAVRIEIDRKFAVHKTWDAGDVYETRLLFAIWSR